MDSDPVIIPNILVNRRFITVYGIIISGPLSANYSSARCNVYCVLSQSYLAMYQNIRLSNNIKLIKTRNLTKIQYDHINYLDVEMVLITSQTYADLKLIHRLYLYFIFRTMY